MMSRSKRIIFGICLSLFTTLIALLLAEVALRVALPEQQLLDERTDAYWKLVFRQAVEHKEPRAKDVQHDPALGWRMKPYFVNKGIHHNSLGFRGQREFGPKGTRRRAFVIGASMAYGLGMDDAKTFGSLLETATGAELINAGVNGYGTDQALLMWEHEGPRLRPDLVVLVYHIDDYVRNGLTFRDSAKPYFVRSNDTFQLAGVPVPDRTALLASDSLQIPAHLRVADAWAWLGRRLRQKYGIADRREKALEALDVYLLKRLRDSVHSAGGELVVVLAGHCYQGPPSFSERAVTAATQTLGIRFVNTIAKMRGAEYASYYAKNCHWSERGQSFVAKTLRDLPELNAGARR